MVNTGRHGDTTLEYKPCLKQCACADFAVQSEYTPLSWDQNGFKFNRQAPNTSYIAGNISDLEITDSTVYKYHQLAPESSQYAFIHTACPLASDSLLDSVIKAQNTLPYFEIPKFTGSRSQCNPRSKGQIVYSGTPRLKLVILSFILSMLLLCKGCSCVCSENQEVSVPLNPYLSQFNETNMAAVTSGQCLTVTEDLAEKVCEKSKKVTDRTLLLRDYRTNFCGLPLDNLLSPQEKDSVQCARDNGCARVFNRVQQIDEDLCNIYHQFLDVLGRIDCADMFPEKGNCDLCKDAYKRWLCSVYNSYYTKGDPMKPCIDFCDAVSETCPFFRPHGETLIGEPGFICKDSNYYEDPAANFYGPEGCCFKPCKVFEGIKCPDYTQTSNCTAISNSSSPSSTNCISHHVLYVLIVFWICCSWSRHQRFPWDISIGLT